MKKGNDASRASTRVHFSVFSTMTKSFSVSSLTRSNQCSVVRSLAIAAALSFRAQVQAVRRTHSHHRKEKKMSRVGL